MYDNIIVEPQGDGVVLLTLNRPEFANGVVPPLIADVLDALGKIEADFDTRALVITGAGKQFCAGADLPGMRHYVDAIMPELEEPYNSRELAPLTQRITTSRLPVIAAVNGGASAGGLDLAMACDIRIASTRAKLGETYVKVGLAPGNGGAYFLPRIVGSGMAMELALTGDLVDAERALAIGLVNRVVAPDQLIAEAVSLAKRIATNPRRAVEATKQALRASWHMDLASVMAASYWTTSALQATRDFREGVQAAIEKRPAVFNRKPGA